MKSSSEREINKYTPAFEPISLRDPTDAEKEIDLTLRKYMDGHKDMQLESDEEMSRRDTVLFEVRGIFLGWVQFVATEVLHLSIEEAEEAGGEMFVSGSQRLGVRDIGADIDVVCVAPNFCTKEHFFTFLQDIFLNHPDVTEFNAVGEAFVPLMSFDFRKVSIDLLFARLAENSVPADVDILDDKILSGLDEASVVSLNGPRVTNMIVKLVGERSYPNFLIVLRCIRRWAKSRGLYGNKLGYLGGVNCNILVAFLCQLYPHSGPSNLLAKFFRFYGREWKWPEPIMLNNILPDPADTPISEQKEIWSKEKNPFHLMPIITPAYPAMNSLHNASVHTFEVMQREFKQSHEIMDRIFQDGGTGWDRLFEKSDFFIRYSHYLACHMIGLGDDVESRRWIGFCESRIRRLLQYLEKLPIKAPIQLYPNKSKTQLSPCSICYFIGFDFDMEFLNQVDNKNIHIDYCVEDFQ
jgi:poly(A) polymerase